MWFIALSYRSRGRGAGKSLRGHDAPFDRDLLADRDAHEVVADDERPGVGLASRRDEVLLRGGRRDDVGVDGEAGLHFREDLPRVLRRRVVLDDATDF